MLKKIILLFVNAVVPFYKDYKKCLLTAKINDLSFYDYLKFQLGMSRLYWFLPKTCIVGMIIAV